MAGDYTHHILDMPPNTGFRFAGQRVFLVQMDAEQVQYVRCRMGLSDPIFTSGVYQMPRNEWDKAAWNSKVIGRRVMTRAPVS